MGFEGSKKAGFAFRGTKNESARKVVGGYSTDMLHKLECKVCPLNNQKKVLHQHMKPHGSDEPLVYFLGEAPGEEEDEAGRPFIGRAGRTLRFRIPKEWEDDIRMNNVVRTRPPGNRTPEPIEIECCRPSIIRDIEETKPKAIFGFGNVPLAWALPGQSGITRWTMRRIPVKIGEHSCWFFPMLHPSYVMRTRKFVPKSRDEYGSEDEFLFAKNLKWAFDEVDCGLPPPRVHTREQALQGIDIITGHDKYDLRLVEERLSECCNTNVVGLDYETNATRPYYEGAKILSAAVSSRDGTFAFAIDHPAAGWTDEQRDELQAIWAAFLTDSDCVKVAHQASFEIEWSAFFFGKDTAWYGKWEDTMGQAYLLDERNGKQSLEMLCLQHFGINVKAINNTDAKNLENTELDVVLRYNGLDAKYHRLLFLEQAHRIDDAGLNEVYDEHMRRVITATLTQLKGAPVDQGVVESFLKKYEDERDIAEEKLFEIPEVRKFKNKKGGPFRPSATVDISTMLHNLGYHDFENVEEATLKEIDHPFAQAVLDWKKPHKAVSTYIMKMLPTHKDSVVFPDGLLHPVLSCDKTVTWRSSSEEPNIQNFHKRGDMRELRGMVKAPPGHKIVSFDYAGIQARNVAMESLDQTLIDAFWNDYDIHSSWMEKIQKVAGKWDGKKLATDKDYAKEARHTAKNKFVFPSFFGATPHTVAYYLEIDGKFGETVQEEFWDEFHDIYKWHNDLRDHYKKHGWITGLSGMIRRAPISSNQMINAPIQADESLIVFDAMTRLSMKDYDKFQATLMVHDDLTFIWPVKKIEEYAETVVETMVNTPYEWARVVPIGVEMSIGDDWGSVKEVAKFATHTWKGVVEIKEDHT